jgi:hypothetical protein
LACNVELSVQIIRHILRVIKNQKKIQNNITTTKAWLKRLLGVTCIGIFTDIPVPKPLQAANSSKQALSYVETHASKYLPAEPPQRKLISLFGLDSVAPAQGTGRTPCTRSQSMSA